MFILSIHGEGYNGQRPVTVYNVVRTCPFPHTSSTTSYPFMFCVKRNLNFDLCSPTSLSCSTIICMNNQIFTQIITMQCPEQQHNFLLTADSSFNSVLILPDLSTVFDTDDLQIHLIFLTILKLYSYSPSNLTLLLSHIRCPPRLCPRSSTTFHYHNDILTFRLSNSCKYPPAT